MVTNWNFSRKYPSFLKMDIFFVQNEKVKILFKIQKHTIFLHMKGTFFDPFFTKKPNFPTSCSMSALSAFTK